MVPDIMGNKKLLEGKIRSRPLGGAKRDENLKFHYIVNRKKSIRCGKYFYSLIWKSATRAFFEAQNRPEIRGEKIDYGRYKGS